MTPEDFLDQVATTNVVELGENRSSSPQAPSPKQIGNKRLITPLKDALDNLILDMVSLSGG
jgi:hypothetical protein